MIKKDRAINQPGNNIGKIRQQFYKSAVEHCKKAMEEDFYLEAITIIESMIADRLESRVAWLSNQKIRQLTNLGPLIKTIKKDYPLEYSEHTELFENLDTWRKDRNKFIHEMVKIEDGSESFEIRLTNAKKTAVDGLKIFSKLSNYVTKANKVV